METVTVEEEQSYEYEHKNESNMSNDLSDDDATEKFQNFLCELFNKKGVLNDLRAYLRGQIVNVLRCAQTGDLLVTQKHIAQRLDNFYQAMNILLAEYLLSLEFSYTLSVFVSEIPLSNMAFDFAKTLQQNNAEKDSVKFTDNDVWSIIKCLGLKCNKSHVVNMINMYQSEEQLPLLVCILRCTTLCSDIDIEEHLSTASDALSAVNSSSDCEIRKQDQKSKCAHFEDCNTCKCTLMKMVNYYKAKTRDLSLTLDELQTAYNIEIQQLREEEDKKLKRSLADHSLMYQKRQEELEEAFRVREMDLARKLVQKKKFLWGVARALRDQHERMANAMIAIKSENKRLVELEKHLRSELTKAQEQLKSHAAGIRDEIAEELKMMEKTLQSMKKERCEIEREKEELEQLKKKFEQKADNDDTKDLKYYDLLKKEISSLKLCMVSIKNERKPEVKETVPSINPQIRLTFSVLNSSETTDSALLLHDTTSTVIPDEKTVDSSQVSMSATNKLKGNVEKANKEKCELCYCKLPIIQPEDSTSANYGANIDELKKLKEENLTLRRLSQRQSDRIEELCGQLSELLHSQSHTTQPPPRNDAPPPSDLSFGGLSSLSAIGGRNGGGEALCMYAGSAVRPRVSLPGDNLPFISAAQDRQADARRHIINQWRALRRRYSPQNARPRPPHIRLSARTDSTHVNQMDIEKKPSSTDTNTVPYVEDDDVYPESTKNTELTNMVTQQDSSYQQHISPSFLSPTLCRTQLNSPPSGLVSPPNLFESGEKSPHTILREAKQNLKNKKVDEERAKNSSREKSPSCVLREAKQRLRKLEMETDAAERSYNEFKKRLEHVKHEEVVSQYTETSSVISRNASSFTLQTGASAKLSEDYNFNNKDVSPSSEIDIDQMKQHEYQNNLSIDRCNNMVEKIKATYETYFTKCETKHSGEQEQQINVTAENSEKGIDNYLEKPLNEFRSYYYLDLHPKQETSDYESKSQTNQRKDRDQDDNLNADTNINLRNSSYAVPAADENENEDCEVYHQTTRKGSLNDLNTINSKPKIVDESSNAKEVDDTKNLVSANESEAEGEVIAETERKNKVLIYQSEEEKSDEESTLSERTNDRPEYNDVTADVDNYYRGQSDISLDKLSEERLWE